MAIFENELIDNKRGSNELPMVKPELASPTIKGINTNLGGFEDFTTKGTSVTGLTIDQLSNFSSIPRGPRGFNSPMQMIPKSELLENQRYGTYLRDRDLENIYGLQQGWTSQLANGVVKFAGTAIGTFAQSFATIPNTLSAIKTGKMSELSGQGGYESDIDRWLKNMEDAFPNYMTKRERDHPYLAMVPFAPGSANFWGNMFIKNLGFTAGAIGGAIAQDAIVGAVTEGVGSEIGRAHV